MVGWSTKAPSGNVCNNQMLTNVTQWTQLPTQFHAFVAAHPGAVLLQTARFDDDNHRSLLFLHPELTLTVAQLEELPSVFKRIEDALADGCYVAGYLGYECGYHFQDISGAVPEGSGAPLAWFGIYRDPIVFDHREGCVLNGASLPETWKAVGATPDDAIAGDVMLQLAEDEYVAKVRRIKDYIAAGDTYQVNFTDRVEIEVPRGTVAFQSLLRHQPVAYSAFLNLPECQILSFSPELFFRVDRGRITTRPMKGTMPRGLDLADDREAGLRLQLDEKNRSEHVMIVDLLRNDLGRICTMGSVEVEDIFAVETYRTLLQMTSTVSGTLRSGLSYYDIFRSLFPCGSITGAPKIRTMEIIRELEEAPRGVYTGAIGYMAPDGSAAFSVAIRTLELRDGRAIMGVGGGIVADSDPAAEYRECLLKASFLTRQDGDFQLIETMLWLDGIVRLDLHLKRLEDSAAYFGFGFERDFILTELRRRCAGLQAQTPHRVRLLLNSQGSVTIGVTERSEAGSHLRVRISSQAVSSSDVFLRHKTTRRQFYEEQLEAARKDGFDEVLFVNERGEITEGAISNVFIRVNERLFTPPLVCGVLPGVFRQHLLQTDPMATERILTLEDLHAADAVYLCSSLRGLRMADELTDDRDL
jgi:para-aminobenzoate synthetase/4-amino-4-deoxychorismate lyase